MSSPLTGDDVSFAPEARPAPVWRAADARPVSLFWTRVRRSVRRQASAFIVAAVLITGVGSMYAYADGVPWTIAVPICLSIGLFLAFATCAVFELSRNTITSVASLGKHRGYTVLGAAPELTPEALRELPPDQRTPLGCLIYQPASPFATAFRDLQGGIGKSGLVAFVSSVPNDGASTVALGAAVSATQQGRKVLLVDCDVRRRSLTRSLVGDVETGIAQAADRPQGWQNLLMQESETGLDFMPAAPPKNPWATLVGMHAFPLLVEDMRREYDLVVFDCPPVLASAEGATLARLADKCVVVAAWDDTAIGTLRQSMRAINRPEGSMGIYVNRVPPGYRFGRLRPD